MNDSESNSQDKKKSKKLEAHFVKGAIDADLFKNPIEVSLSDGMKKVLENTTHFKGIDEITKAMTKHNSMFNAIKVKLNKKININIEIENSHSQLVQNWLEQLSRDMY